MIPWATDKIREKLLEAHKQENEFNREIAKMDANIKYLLQRKAAYAKRVSKNMQYRNKLIKML